MGNLDCSNLTIDTQNEIKSADFNRKNTYISKNNILKINAPIRNTKKSKTSSPKILGSNISHILLYSIFATFA